MSIGATTTTTPKRTWFIRLWIGVCYLAWALSEVGAEQIISEHNSLHPGTADDYTEFFGEVETWESAAAVPRIFGLGEPDSRCDAADRSSCKCVNRNCGCCSRIKIPKIRQVGNCCVNVSYLSENIGVKVTFSFNDRILFEKEVSASNPPPLCLRIPVPVIKHAAAVCIRFVNLRHVNKTLCGCIKIGIKVAIVKEIMFQLGCFGIPIGAEKEAEQRRADLLVRGFMDVGQRESKWKDIQA